MGMFDFLGDKKSDQTLSDLVVPKKPNTPAPTQAAPAAIPDWAKEPAAVQPKVNDPTVNEKLFLDFIARAEGGSYDIIVGGKQRITDFSRHPRIRAVTTADGSSDAAGRYQILSSTYQPIADKLGIKDFSPQSQDRVALEIIKRRGALEDVRSGNFEGAINKLGNIWASFPTSPYKQGKKSWEWTRKELAALTGGQPSPLLQRASTAPQPNQQQAIPDWARDTAAVPDWAREPLPQEAQASAQATGGYKPFAPVRKDIDEATLNKDPDFIRASMMMYELFERKKFEGNGSAAAEYGKNGIAAFNYNLVDLAVIGKKVTSEGTQEQKEAFLYMLDTYENTNVSWAGFKRGAWQALTDPTNIIGVGTLGVATAGKFLGRKTFIEGVKTEVKQSIKQQVVRRVGESVARTGTVAGIDTAVAMAATDATKQGVAVSAGRQKEVDSLQVAKEGGKGFVFGLVGGTLLDATVAKIYRTIRGTPEVSVPGAKATPEAKADFTVDPQGTATSTKAAPTSGVTKEAEAVLKAVDEGKAPSEMTDDLYKAALENDIPLKRETTADDIVAALREKAGKVADDAAPAGPLGSTLTPEEIAAATARKQEGRLPADDVVPDMSVPPATKVEIDPMNTGLRSTPMSMEELSSKGSKVADQLRTVSDQDMPKVLEVLRTADDLTFEQTRVAARGIQMYADELRITKAELVKKLDVLDGKLGSDAVRAELDALQARLDPLELADDAYGSMAGSLLRQRQEGLPGVQGITIESIMAEKGIPRAEAEQVWADLVGKAQQSAEVKKMEATYEARAQEALAEGDLTQAAMLAAQKRFEAAAMGEQIASGSASWSAKLTEAAISNVFSIKTVLINLIPSGIKTLVIPSLKFMAANPLEKAARVELAASYSAMASGFRGALDAAVAGYKYEQALLTRDGARLLEEGLAIEGRKGGVIRFFPRILNASDEFLARLNYDSFVAGRAAAEAAVEGDAKGLKGKELDAFIKEATATAVRDSKAVDNSTELVQPIINKGVNLGLTGDDLFKYVEAEAVKNPQALLKGTDDEALDFVRDVLYKRQFSGEGNASKAAQAYEETMRKFPSAKLLLGQLFFRTPIRVFEEGVRLTPGLQLIAPNFVADLAGKNGTLRQIRAQSEAMSSLAVAGAVMSLYAQGRITGDGAYSDWKQQRNRTDGPLPEPYTIKMSDGSTWSYRGFDPLATPVKIMINGLERLDRLHIRQAQGEFVNKTEFDAAQAYVTVGTTAVAQAFRDANLVAGINTTISLAENLSDPERKEDAWLKYLGEKLFLTVPNTLHKVAKDNDPTIKDPAIFWQVVDQTLARPFGQSDKMIKTAFSYDVLGNPRRASDTGALWNVFSTATPEERAKGMSPEAQIVLTELDRLSRVTGATFKPPMKHADLGDLDLRTVVASDGKRTLYDVWQDNYRNLKPEVPLAALAQAPLPDGTFKVKADKVAEMQQVIKEFQDAAFAITMKQEEKVMKRFIDQTLNEAKAKAGLFDMNRPR
jgi:muramidase (phage lysozyme)